MNRPRHAMKARDLFLAEALIAIGSAVVLVVAVQADAELLMRVLLHAPWLP